VATEAIACGRRRNGRRGLYAASVQRFQGGCTLTLRGAVARAISAQKAIQPARDPEAADTAVSHAEICACARF